MGRAAGGTRALAMSAFSSPWQDEPAPCGVCGPRLIHTTEKYWARRRLLLLDEVGVRIGTNAVAVDRARGFRCRADGVCAYEPRPDLDLDSSML